MSESTKSVPISIPQSQSRMFPIPTPVAQKIYSTSPSQGFLVGSPASSSFASPLSSSAPSGFLSSSLPRGASSPRVSGAKRDMSFFMTHDHPCF